MTENQYPPLDEQGKNLARFAFDLIKTIFKGEPIYVSEEVVNARMKICRECDKYDRENIRCYECGCMLEQKTKFALDSCPLEKWDVDDSSWMDGEYKKYLT